MRSWFTDDAKQPRPLRPQKFRPAGDVQFAKLTAIGPFNTGKKVRVTGARAQGIRYEKKVHAEMFERYPQHYINNPWFKFFEREQLRWCQPDGLLIDIKQGLIVIVEVKYRHTGEAWWKLQHLYLPVVRAQFGPGWEYRCVEVVQWYDSATIFPGAKLCEHLHMAPFLPFTGVHICTP